MSQSSINQRLKLVIDHMGLSARAFSELIGESPTNTQNYVGKRNSMPGADYLEKVLSHFEFINPMWLTTGKGEPFLGEASATETTSISNNKTKGTVQNNTGKHATVNNNVTLEDCKRNLETSQREVEQLKALLAAKDELIAAKEEMLSLLRAGHNRPN